MAEDADKDSKTEQPTDKRLEKAREEGNVASSQEVKSLATLVGALVTVAFLAPSMLPRISEILVAIIETAHKTPLTAEAVREITVVLILDLAWVMAPVLVLLVVFSIIANVAQVGLMWTPKKLHIKLTKLDPIAGAKKMVAAEKPINAVKDILKIGIVTTAVMLVVVPMMPHPDVLVGKPFGVTLKTLHWLLIMLLIAIVVAFAAMVAADVAWTRYRHATKLKMTKQEVKDEYKQAEGDPQLKGRIRALRLERSRTHMMAEVPSATVVITNPTHYACALSYDMDNMTAPRLVAKGVDHLALRIRQVAEENDVPVVENPPLARAIHASVDLDEEIPQDHYKAVAEVIGYVMRLKGKQT